MERLRLPDDGQMEVLRDDPDHLIVRVETGGVMQHIRMSNFNAARVLASLSIFLELPLSVKAQKEIKF
jgi:hypothetical protein